MNKQNKVKKYHQYLTYMPVFLADETNCTFEYVSPFFLTILETVVTRSTIVADISGYGSLLRVRTVLDKMTPFSAIKTLLSIIFFEFLPSLLLLLSLLVEFFLDSSLLIFSSFLEHFRRVLDFFLRFFESLL